VLLARALVQEARVMILDEPFGGVDPASGERMDAILGELRGERRAIVVATHDVAAARTFDRVLCLNGRQVAFGEPGTTLSRAVLEATYGSEIVVLEEDGGPVRAVAVQHHEH
jgi:manganese/iron transport system ATP-binding protein/manganese/zinc/iron transport system ATP- binding protein